MAGIYIHIPFCSSRCIYCGFFSTTNLNQRERYTAALCQELKMRCKELQEEKITTIYFGGGTPSLLSPQQLKLIFNTIEDYFNVSEVQEITLECNPDDISHTFLSNLKELPINRISMGIQSFNDETLHFLKRRHNSIQAINAVKNCKDAGYNNISIDLIYGIPGQNSQDFKSDIETAVSLDVTHISSYHLSYEEETPIWQMLINKKIDSIDEEESVQMYNILCDTLKENDFNHYEISNFAKNGFESKHNSSYWNGVPYLGVGAGAHSFDGDTRRWNPDNLNEYIEGIELGHTVYEEEHLTLADKHNEAIMLGLRKQEGISLSNFKNRFGEELYNLLLSNTETQIKSGTLIKERDRIHFSEHGLFISDNIVSSLFIVD